MEFIRLCRRGSMWRYFCRLLWIDSEKVVIRVESDHPETITAPKMWQV